MPSAVQTSAQCHALIPADALWPELMSHLAGLNHQSPQWGFKRKRKLSEEVKIG